MFTNICSSDTKKSKDFYMNLFDFRVNFESDWYIHLIGTANESLELGIIDKDYDLVPEQYNGKPMGVYITFVVDDVDAVYEKAKKMGCDILHGPEPTFYGQKRMLLKDPDGCLVDVSSLIPDYAAE